MQQVGFGAERISNSDEINPKWLVTYSKKAAPMVCYSKTFKSPENPQKEFGAVMTCDNAYKNCPFVWGASFKIAVPYEDPKNFDGTDEESKQYLSTCNLIGIEMFYVFSLLKERK